MMGQINTITYTQHCIIEVTGNNYFLLTYLHFTPQEQLRNEAEKQQEGNKYFTITKTNKNNEKI